MALVTDPMDTRNTVATDGISAENVWDMISAIDIAMLITHCSEGLRGRPMSTIPRRELGAIYLLTEASSTAARDIAQKGAVLLAYQNGGDHIALRGEAKVDRDPALVKRLWNPGAQMFWPDGPEAHDVVALTVDPGHADVWDGHGLLRGIANIVKGVVRGEQPDLGTRGEADL